jgi:hypothetical protein
MRAIFLVCGLPLTCRPVGHRTRSQGRRYFVFRRRPPSRAMPQRKFSGLIEGELFPGPALSGCSLTGYVKGGELVAASRTRWRALPFCTLVYFFHACVRDGRACISGDEAPISRPLRAQKGIPFVETRMRPVTPTERLPVTPSPRTRWLTFELFGTSV